MNKNSDQQAYYSSQENSSSRYSNRQYSHNGRNYPQSAPPNQQPYRFDNQDRSREFNNSTYYPNEQQRNHFHRPYQPNNFSKACFNCGSYDHIKAQCPTFKKANLKYQQKFSS